MKKNNLKTGYLGEKEAQKYLIKKGYQIIKTNHRTRFGEIDIIAKKGERTVFVEVKTKTGDQYGEPYEMVDQRKIAQIKRIAQMYLVKQKIKEPLCRIDVIGVWFQDGNQLEKIEHWENVY